MALTIEKLADTVPVIPARGSVAIAANTRVFKGALVAINSSGLALPGTTKAGGAVRTVGFASHTVDNRNGSALGGTAGAAKVEVEYGVIGCKSGTSSDAITVAHVGRPVFVIDDETVGLTDGGAGARIPAGVVTEVRDGTVYVMVGPHISAMISGAAL